jgi:hypothetical protein
MVAAGDWITAEGTDVDDKQLIGRSRMTNYLVLGFMASRTKIDRVTKHANAAMFILTSVAVPPDAYEKLGVDDEGHLVLEFDQRQANTPVGQQTAPNPQGISGGGVWSLCEGADHGGYEPRLVAITIERHRHPVKAIVGTRLAMFFEVIRSKYPELDLDVPRSHVRNISSGER